MSKAEANRDLSKRQTSLTFLPMPLPFSDPGPASCPRGEQAGVNHFIYPYECDVPCEACVHRLDCIRHTGRMMKSHIDSLTKKAVNELGARP